MLRVNPVVVGEELDAPTLVGLLRDIFCGACRNREGEANLGSRKLAEL
jgi:hypothetical protein